MTELDKEVIKLAQSYKKCAIKLYEGYNAPTLSEKSFSKEKKEYKYFLEFYNKLIETDYFDNTFNMYNFLKAQKELIFPAQLKTKKAENNFKKFLKEKENEVKIKNITKDVIQQEIKKTLELISFFLEENEIKYKDFYFFKKNENDLMPYAFFLIIQNQITIYIWGMDQNFIKSFEQLPLDYQKSYEYLLQDAANLREYLRKEKNKLYQNLLDLNKKLKETL